MDQLRKDFHKRMALQLVVMIVLYFLAAVSYDLIVGVSLTDAASMYTIYDESICSAEDLEYQIPDGQDVFEVEKLWVEDSKIFYTVHGKQPGEAFLIINRAGTGEFLTSELFRVDRTGRITCVFTGNYANWRFHLLLNVVFLTVFAAICLIDLLYYRKKMLYSYDIMFVGGLLIWLVCTSIIQWYAYCCFEFAFEYYAYLQRSAYLFMLYTAPVVWIFCIALSVSNISLIRHEGYRPVNALGIMISVLLMLGSIIGVAAGNAIAGTASEQSRINIAVSSCCSVYSVFACLLEGAVIGGIAAAKHIPPMDCDYIIILGCSIRRDGSLTPLLRGRADRAIEHAEAQERTTGKKAVFVPSGGKGGNEVMAEGEAIKQYLLSRGIPEDRILVEDRSRNTAENMLFSKALIDARKTDARIAFSTTNYHVFRSGIIATQKNFCPEGMGSKTKWYFWPNAFIREFLGMVVYTKFTIAGIMAAMIVVFAMLETLVVR